MLSEEAVAQSAPWIALPGNLFLALIKMVVIPLVFSSIVLGLTSSTDPDFLKKAAVRIFPYFIATTAVAVAIGIGLTLLIEPGKYINPEMIRDITQGSPTDQIHVDPTTANRSSFVPKLRNGSLKHGRDAAV